MVQYHVAHILLQHQYKADDVLKKLKAGESFELLAQKFSKCPSSAQNGDLGPLKTGRADPDFEEASLSLKVGEMTQKPVRTRFGYHLIKRIG